jgi:1-deoxy-D-xylulose-5-phosphate synthase
MSLLQTINSPADLKKLNPNQLPELAGEIRHFIIDTIAKNSGHFGGPLGCVDICIALHYVFDSPKDKIVWDVGYQAYAHKILTGRRDNFGTLRQWQGVAPFPRVEESPHDTTNPGHGSTSISAALGYALARDLKGKSGKDETVLAVIGDGSLVGGLALEGLHQAGHLKRDLIIVLNDNEMGISHNHSALAGHLQRLRHDPVYMHARQNFEELLKKLPGGDFVIETGKRAKAGMKTMITPGMMFEELGLHYLGPVNGHSFPELISAFKTARTLSGPILLHLVTKKGKGWEQAEADDGQVKWHAATPADFQDKQIKDITEKPELLPDEKEGKAVVEKPKKKTYTQVFSDALIELAEKDERIVAITAAMPGGTGIDKFIEKFPSRGFDVGMVEEHAVTFASGLALGGMRPVVTIYSTFLQRSYDQILHDVCQVAGGLPVVFALDRGGLVGEDGATHQGVFDYSYLRNIPHMVIMAPKDEGELRHMMATALNHDGPSAVRYPRGEGVGCDLKVPFQILPIGKAEELRGQGESTLDVAVLAAGYSVQPALEAADKLIEEGHKIGVVNARFIKPLDETLISAIARRAKKIITVEENVAMGGFGSAVLELLAREGILVPTTLIGVPDEFIHHGAQKIQRRELGLDADGLLYTFRRHLPRAVKQRAKAS